MKDFFEKYGERINISNRDECWEWKGATISAGYGHGNRNGKHFYAHRASYESKFGPIPKGLMVRHKCDNPPCVNPSHLEVGTNMDNVNDCHSRGRARRAVGEDASKAKLTASEVIEIRSLVSDGMSQSEAGRKFKINHRTINAIVHRHTWRHI